MHYPTCNYVSFLFKIGDCINFNLNILKLKAQKIQCFIFLRGQYNNIHIILLFCTQIEICYT